MTDAVTPMAVTERRNNFEQVMRQQEEERLAEARVVAQKMASLMAHGERFSVKDFIFVASMGEPEKYKYEQETLETIDGLWPGEIVGVTEAERLWVVGVTSDEPLDMRVTKSSSDSLGDERQGVELRAYLRLSIAEPKAYDNITHQVIKEEDGRILAPIFFHWPSDNRLIDISREPNRIIFGADKVLEHVCTSDIAGAALIAGCLRKLASTAPLGHLSLQRQSS